MKGHREHAMWRHGIKVMGLQAKQDQRWPENHQKLGQARENAPLQRFLREQGFADTVISNFQTPALGNHTVLLFKPPGLWHFGSSRKLMQILFFHLETDLVG